MRLVVVSHQARRTERGKGSIGFSARATSGVGVGWGEEGGDEEDVLTGGRSDKKKKRAVISVTLPARRSVDLNVGRT